ncbi:ABC transporter ATP-binding protein [Azospirillum sp. RWY-5-1]|uniref:ABC transporter ATP-binding protein n=1 Tax=Azospirillum oleiclasticum TaxID=2735135 RepID=A0ABX2TFS4_9PROT|nr:ABC transporter ATP-binding protein [Azospirillum oleiclasticum]NYZ14459.1 ABC transporter ATP-binding protein [Azospirillum oleiclasticum]NYZ23189.1 ABC transporter ATP-binding protein [Azospirillum oleiclasticum]
MTATAGSVCLEVRDATRSFGGLVAVNAVSFQVARHSVTAVIGPNGAGKTTLFNLISGAVPPSSGRVLFEGTDVTHEAPEAKAARGLIRTFQLVKLFPELSAVENVKVGFHLRSRGGLLAALLRPRAIRDMEAAIEDRARALLHLVGLGSAADLPAAALSYGQGRLLEVARALAAQPKLLMLDEPAAGLNGDETARLASLIRDIAEDGTAVLLIEHDMHLVMNTADEVVVVDFGRKIAQGAPDRIRQDPAVIAAYLG